MLYTNFGALIRARGLRRERERGVGLGGKARGLRRESKGA